ncbi:MAG TPA: cupin domain-containing protein [Gaiellaceae bacterium]|nr:cupin domain-containing protein [Gaiellaceae bacterium]
MANPSNVWDLELASAPEEWGAGVRGRRLLDRSRRPRLVSAVWELDPGARSPHYHAHHAAEEMLLVLRGTPILRTPDGERTLAEGDVVHFPVGANGAHQVRNDSSEVVRYLMIAAHSRFDAVEYIDEARIVVYSLAESALQGERLSFSHELRDE